MIKKNILTLYRVLISRGLQKEANWTAMLYLTAGYDDDWRNTIDQISGGKEYPFSSWFPNGSDRVTIGFVREEDEPPDSVVNGLGLLGFSIENYLEGYAVDNNSRKVKIGRAISKSKIRMEKRLREMDQESEEYTALVANIAILDEALNVFNNDPNRARSKESNYQIIISQNPHDVARSSYGRNWESCFDIGSGPKADDAGSNAQTIFCEVKDGGMVAYLTRPDDNDIEDPYARILIRRFVNQEGTSLALAEDSIYGDEIAGFQEKVNAWLQEKNVAVPAGRYKRMGGSYSDTFDEEEFIAPKDEQRILSWLSEKFDVPEEEIVWTVEDSDYEVLGESGWWRYNDPFQDNQIFFENTDWEAEWESDSDGTKTFDKEIDAKRFLGSLKHYGEMEEYMNIKLREEGYDYKDIERLQEEGYDEKFDEYWEERFSLTPTTNNYKNQLKESAAAKVSEGKEVYSPEVIQLTKDFVLDFYENGGTVFSNFLDSYPNSITEEDFFNLKPGQVSALVGSDNISDEKAEEFQRLGAQAFDSMLGFDSIAELAQSNNRNYKGDQYNEYRTTKEIFSKNLSYTLVSAISDAGKYIRQMDERQVNKLLEFGSKIQNTDLLEDREKNALYKNIMHEVYVNGRDEDYHMIAPLVEILMSKYDPSSLKRDSNREVGLGGVGFYVAKLGAIPGAADKYLPIFKDQLLNLDKIVDEDVYGSILDSQKNEHLKKRRDGAFQFTEQRINYIIDSIENGTGRSEKYKWWR
tara:strand:+ start:521 stop:2770 length:2250 start_codon:yes stop_codon:yes gene_type:complete